MVLPHSQSNLLVVVPVLIQILLTCTLLPMFRALNSCIHLHTHCDPQEQFLTSKKREPRETLAAPPPPTHTHLFWAPQNFRGGQVGRMGKPLTPHTHCRIAYIALPLWTFDPT